MNITFNQFNKTKYPYLDDSYIDNYIPVAYGKIASVKLTPINSNYDTDNGDVSAVYRMPDGMTNYGTAYVKIDDTWVAATVESVDYDTGLITISNGRSESGSTYECKLTDCYGYMFDGHCYPRQALQHWYATYGNIQYTDSNFNKTEWVAALDDSRYQADFGLLLDDYSKDEDSDTTYDLDYFNKVVYNIATFGGKMYCRVDYDPSGKITATLKDYDRTASDTIASADIYDNNTLSASTTADSAYTSVIEKYYHNTVDDNYLSLEDNTYEKYVKQNYRIMQSLTDKSYLINEDDAKTRAAELALEYKHIPVEFEINVRDRYTTRLYDVVTVALMPDNLDSSMRQYAGNKDCLVTGVAPFPDKGYTTLTVQIIPDRTASVQQLSVRNSAYTTVARSKSSTQIITDNLKNQITDNLLLTGSLSLVSINLNATTAGVVSDFSKATGTFNVKYNGTDITGNGPVYAVVSQTGCTGTIDSATGVYAVSALSADVGILLLKATYEEKSIETSFTVTKAVAGVDSTAFTITDPNTTVPYSGMTYDNTYYGMCNGVWYKWSWTSTTAGKWTKVSPEYPTNIAVRYSFDEMPDLPDDSGATYKKDADFTTTSPWTATQSTLSIVSGELVSTPTTTSNEAQLISSTLFNGANSGGKIVKIKVYSPVVTHLHLIDLTHYATYKTFNLNIGYNTISFIFPTDSYNYYLIAVTRSNSLSLRYNQIYIGDGTTSQPVIDNVSGSVNAVANGVVSVPGVSGKACQFLGVKALQLDLSKYANVQSWWVSAWLNIPSASFVNYKNVFTGSSGRYRKLWWFLSTSGFVMSLLKTSQQNITIPVSSISDSWHCITSQVIVNSSTETIMKLYLDGVLYGSLTLADDYTDLAFSTVYLGGLSLTSDVVSGFIDDFQFGVGEITATQVLGLYLQRASATKLYTLADYNYDNSVSSWEIVSSVSAFTKVRSGVVSPSLVTLSAKAIISSTAESYLGRFIIYEDGASVYTSSADESSHTYSPASGISAIRIELYKSGGTSVLVATKEFAVSYAADVAPEYLGIGLLADVSGLTTKAYTSATIDDDGTITAGSSNSAVITGDWMINYTAGTYRALGIYYWSGTAWTITSDSKYSSDGCLLDILRLNKGGITLDGWTSYTNLIAANIFSNKIKLIDLNNNTGAIYGGDRFDEDGNVISRTSDGFYLSANGKLWANIQSDDYYNLILGTGAGASIVASTTLSKYNTLGGYHAGNLNTTGYYNTDWGYKAGESRTGANLCTNIGALAGNKSTGEENTNIGYNAGGNLTTASHCLCAGSGTLGYNTTWSYQMNLNNRVIYLEFNENATQDTVYKAISWYISTAGQNVGAFGRFGSQEITRIYNRGGTAMQFVSNADISILECTSGSPTTINSALQVCFIRLSAPTANNV
jgi:hypothetical protein